MWDSPNYRTHRYRIFDELKRSSPKLQVSFDTYHIAPQGRIPRTVELRNVVAICVTGHYDSVNLGPGVSATLASAFGGIRRERQMLPAPTTTRAASR